MHTHDQISNLALKSCIWHNFSQNLKKKLGFEGAVLNLNIFGIPAPIDLGSFLFENKKLLVSEYHLTLEVKHVVFL